MSNCASNGCHRCARQWPRRRREPLSRRAASFRDDPSVRNRGLFLSKRRSGHPDLRDQSPVARCRLHRFFLCDGVEPVAVRFHVRVAAALRPALSCGRQRKRGGSTKIVALCSGPLERRRADRGRELRIADQRPKAGPGRPGPECGRSSGLDRSLFSVGPSVRSAGDRILSSCFACDGASDRRARGSSDFTNSRSGAARHCVGSHARLPRRPCRISHATRARYAADDAG
ncbi:hypothetical protein ACVW0I_002047 [Bradyrhizobium sp. LM6.11]